ncbi:MAG: bifunctional adenosylcobinamide kinase/adenosylcobinamide-phosphate guanylyltransferase [Pseudomonadota bacterium]
MKTLILGGVKSGKSHQAERIAAQSGNPVTLIATALPGDEEMRQRIARHQQQRPADWQVKEVPYALASAIDSIGRNSPHSHTVIVDCLTLWLTQLLCSPDKSPQVDTEIDQLVSAVKHFNGELIMVASESAMGVTPADPLSRRYLDCAGVLHQCIAAVSDNVTLMVAGLPMVVKQAATE